MKKLFKAIRNNDFKLVKEMIDNSPELVNSVAKQPPKKDDGQSPLQIAIKTGNFDIAEYLIDKGANLDFMEDESCCNDWRTPVLFDAVNAAVMNCRWNANSETDGFRSFSSEEKANQSFELLKKMLILGANINFKDSLGNTVIWRFCLQANQILPAYDYENDCEVNDRLLTKGLEADLHRILKLLCAYGVDIDAKETSGGTSVKEYFTKGAMAKLLSEF
ncbi:MAG: ankyrin repeat domain-containing protein [Erysipelotrichaceae bacterium]|nr:ankyrin repeat domain-containing protein [Erysipelotrichaceae bacterium]